VNNKNDAAYVRLQKHLDRQVVGFPATPTGAEIKILKHIFTAFEAEIAVCLTHRFEPLMTIFERSRHLVNSADALEDHLNRIQQKGGIESKVKGGTKQYCNSPLVVGMYEMQNNRLTPEFIKDFREYTSNRWFGVAFLSTRLPQMRTIPVTKSIQPRHQISTYDEVTALLEQAEAPYVVIECICRKKHALEGESCQVTDRKETCMAFGGMAQTVLMSGLGREISRDEAMGIIARNQKEGLVLQPSNTEKAEFICSCCGCCCGMLGIHQDLPKPSDFWVSNFYAKVDADACEGCGVCERRCQVGAVRVPAKKQTAVVDIDRCLGCGLCVPDCRQQAVSLVKSATEIKPPETREDLHDILVAEKKGRLGKLALIGKLIFDAIRTGHFQLLK
jgi:NAD-dependent dihydropyrimidine dehydrogenase PreA subunit